MGTHPTSLRPSPRLIPLVLFAAVAVQAEASLATPEFAKPEPGRSEAYVDVRAPPAEVFAVLARVDRWRVVFSDVREVEPEPAQGRSRWRVVSRLIGHAHVLELRLEDNRLVHFHLTDPGPGGSLLVDLKLDSSPNGGTRVRYSLVTVLPLGLDRVFDEAFLRRHREHKMRVDLEDIERYFGGLPRPGG